MHKVHYIDGVNNGQPIQTTYFIDGDEKHIYAINDPSALYIIDIDHPTEVYRVTSSSLPSQVVDGGRYLLAGTMRQGITFRYLNCAYIIVDCNMSGLSSYSYMFACRTAGSTHVYFREPIIQYMVSGDRIFQNSIIDNFELEIKNVGTNTNPAIYGRLIGDNTSLRELKIVDSFIKESSEDALISLKNSTSPADLVMINTKIFINTSSGRAFINRNDGTTKVRNNLYLYNCDLSELIYNNTNGKNISYIARSYSDKILFKNCIMPTQLKSVACTWTGNYINTPSPSVNFRGLTYQADINEITFDDCIINDPKYYAAFLTFDTDSSQSIVRKISINGKHTAQEAAYFNYFMAFKSGAPDILRELDCSNLRVTPTYIEHFFGMSNYNMSPCLQKLDLSGMDWSQVALESANLDTLNPGNTFQVLTYYRSPKILPAWSLSWAFLGDNLDHDSVYSIIQALPQVASESGLTCTLSAAQYALLSSSEIQEAESKNWTIQHT